MSIETERVGTSLGGVQVDVAVCDGCDLKVTTDDIVNWIELDDFGVNTPTLGDRPTPLHACSVECARKALDRLSWTRKDPA